MSIVDGQNTAALRKITPPPGTLLLNSTYVDFPSMEVRISAPEAAATVGIPVPIVDVRAVEYRTETRVRWRQGHSSYPVARPRGVTECSGSIEWGFETFRYIATYLSSLGLGGWSDVRFNMFISYLNVFQEPVTETLERVRILSADQRNSSGGGGLTTRSELSIWRVSIQYGNQPAVLPSRPLPTALEAVAALPFDEPQENWTDGS